MKRKIIFFDIDGTLYNEKNQIPNSTYQAIAKLKKQGHMIVIATGRAPFMIEHLLNELELSSFISFNGQFIVFNNKVIYEDPLPVPVIKTLVTDSMNNHHPLLFMGKNEMKTNQLDHPYIHESLDSINFAHPPCDSSFFQTNDVFQLQLYCISGEETIYSDHEDKLKIIRWHDLSIDILPKNGSKAEGIKQISEILNLNKEDMYAFGDEMNDLEMIQYVGTGIAMGNANPLLKENADYVTSSVNNDGILKACQKLNLIN